MFGDELLYLCYEYMDTFKREPADYNMLAEFVKYKMTKGTFEEMRINMASAMASSGE